MNNAKHIDALTDRYTACRTFAAFCGLGNTPSLVYRKAGRIRLQDSEIKMLADAYDARQAATGNARRAFRG